MIALRILALIAGPLVLILPPIFMASAGSVGLPGKVVAASLLALGVVAASFVYVGMVGDRMRRSASQRMLGGVLLAIPIAGSLAVLASRRDPMQLWSGGILLAFSLLLFLSFVYPALERRQRPMRRRERQEPVVLPFRRRT